MAKRRNSGGGARNRQANSRGTSARTPARPLSSFAGHVNRTGLNVLRGDSSALPQAVTMGQTRRRPLAGIHGNVVHGPTPVTMGATRKRPVVPLSSYAGQVNRTGLNVPMGPSQNRAIAAAAKAGPRMTMPTKIGLGIGAAAAVGVLMNRSGSPSDRGRQSSYRY